MSATHGEQADLAGQRGRLIAVAYRLLGSLSDAEDAVQDVGETWARTDPDTIDDPEAWLVTVTTRRCLDRLRSARHRRETYVGPWLPEPLVTDPAATGSSDPADDVVRADEVSFALLVVLDRLGPAERVAFVLHDVFGEPFDRVGAVLDRTPEAARQLASRARRRVRAATSRSPTVPDERATADEVTGRLLAAVREGDLETVVQLLAEDAVLVSDGGGVVSAARRPVQGADRIARFLVGLWAQAGDAARAEPVDVNGGPGTALWLGDHLVGIAALDVRGGVVSTVYIVVNPEKLRHVG